MMLGEIAEALIPDQAAVLASMGLSKTEPAGFSIDSRTIKAGDVFFAIKGLNSDGHQFAFQALEKGAIAIVVERGSRLPEEITRNLAGIDAGNKSPGLFAAEAPASGPGGTTQGRAPIPAQACVIQVEDTLNALQALAAKVIRDWRGREVAITGSAGKTTTKDITAGVMSLSSRTLRSAGNLNNQYGLPLSILKMESAGSHAADYDFAILEMGMNHAGELARLTEIAPPHIGVVTNVNAAHLEFFSSIDAIAEAKSELVSGIRPGGWAVLNADDPRVIRMRNLRQDLNLRTFGLEHDADVQAKQVRDKGLAGTAFELTTKTGSIDAQLALVGRHNLYNTLAAAAVAEICGMRLEEIAAGIAACASSKMRGEILRFREGFTIVDDSYNSNPAAMRALVAAAAGRPGRLIVVAGEMLELGSEAPRLHMETGAYIAKQQAGLLIGVRGLARDLVEGAIRSGLPASRAIFTDTAEEAADILARQVAEGDIVLIKGSRGVRMETIVDAIKLRFDVLG